MTGAVSNVSELLAFAERSSAGSAVPQRLRPFAFVGGERELQRGTRLSTVLRRRAEAFDWGEKAHTLSEAVTGIDCFISHTWSVSRLRKYACLALHFNFFAAFLASVFATLAPLAVLGLDYQTVLTWPAFVAIPIFLLVLFFYRDFTEQVGSGGPIMFLDKTCIHQEDAELKRLGIENIGAFLAHSSSMLVIYSESYLKRLWTVYEVACFLTLRSIQDVVIIPIELPLVFVAGLMVLFVCQVLNAPGALVGFVAHVVLVVLLRYHARAKAKLFDCMDNFDVRCCDCACEDDRPMVHRNIRTLMRMTRLVPADANDGEALVAFNGLVQDELAPTIEGVSGIGLSYMQTVAISLLYMGPLTMADPELLENDLAMIAFWLSNVCFVVLPLDFVVMTKLAGAKLHLRGCSEGLFTACGVVFTSLCLALFLALLLVLELVVVAIITEAFPGLAFFWVGAGLSVAVAVTAKLCSDWMWYRRRLAVASPLRSSLMRTLTEDLFMTMHTLEGSAGDLSVWDSRPPQGWWADSPPPHG